MALKAIMLRRKIDGKKKELEQLRQKDQEFQKREAELETAIEEAETEEQERAVSEEVEAYDQERSRHESAKTELSRDIENLEVELRGVEEDSPAKRTETREKEERLNAHMGIDLRGLPVNIRSLPKNQRLLDVLPEQQRRAIVESDEVKEFLHEIREAGRQKRELKGGDLTIPVVFLELISENMFRYSKLLNRVRVRQVRGQARQTIAGTVPEAVWTEMCGAINELTFVFNQVTLDGYKVAGIVPVCNSILEDSDVELASWIVEMLSEAIGLAKDKSILYGKGSASKMPLGIATRLAQKSAPDGYPANAPEWVDLSTTNILQIAAEKTGAEFWAALVTATSAISNRYARGNRFWAMNSKTLAMLQSKAITFTATGAVVAGVTDTLPVVTGDIDILEFIPDGDIIGGYGDLYLWVQRSGMVLDLSREVQFIQDNTVFRGKERADGMPVIPQAFALININGQAPTTSISFAGDTANEASLSGLSIGAYSLTPSFDPSVMTYSVTATNAADAVTAVPAASSASVALNYNGSNVLNGGSVTWQADGQPHPLTVTVRNGNAVRVYTINVTKAGG